MAFTSYCDNGFGCSATFSLIQIRFYCHAEVAQNRPFVRTNEYIWLSFKFFSSQKRSKYEKGWKAHRSEVPVDDYTTFFLWIMYCKGIDEISLLV